MRVGEGEGHDQDVPEDENEGEDRHNYIMRRAVIALHVNF